MESKRLDLDAPLISVRRIAASKNGKPQLRGENIGAVPFMWEKRPGHPKVALRCSPDCGKEKLIMGDMVFNPVNCGEEFDTLSRNDSFSVSARPSFGESASNFSKDLQMEEYLMGRFLHAAQAVASASPQQVWKKPARAKVVERNFAMAPLVGLASKTQLELSLNELDSQKIDTGSDSQRVHLSQIDPKFAPQRRLPLQHMYEEEEDKEEVEESGETVSYDDNKGYFFSKARGLISRFGFKSSSFCLLNPFPGMKVQDLPVTKPKPSHRIKILNDEGIIEDSWEAVYRHRLRNVDYVQKDIDNKLSTESNQLTYWIDSQTPDGSSFFSHSSVDALSNEDAKNKSKCSKTWSLDSGIEDIESFWEIPSGINRLQGSGSTSSTTDKSRVYSSPLPETSNSNSCLVSKTASTKVSKFQKTERNVVAETSARYQPKSSYSNALNGEAESGNGFKIIQRNDVGFDLKADVEKNIENSMALSLLPLPLPKPPSDSWLQRALPTISAKGPYQKSFSGNQTLQASRGGQKLVMSEKSSKMLPYQTTFAVVPKHAC